jgi:hypothetical protein
MVFSHQRGLKKAPLMSLYLRVSCGSKNFQKTSIQLSGMGNSAGNNQHIPIISTVSRGVDQLTKLC